MPLFLLLLFTIVDATELDLVNTIIYPGLGGNGGSPSSMPCQAPGLSSYSPPAVVCNGSRVVELHFNNLGLTGTISDDVALLEQLDVFRIFSNSIHSTLPSTFSSGNIGEFDATSNELDGSIVFPLGVRRFLGGSNQFEGQLPPLPASLEYINLYGNSQLNGTLPPWAPESKLWHLGLPSNKISGDLPLPLPESLKFIYLLNTDISGSLGTSLPVNLTHLSVQGAQFVGSLPPLPPNMWQVNVANNLMNFTLPNLWPSTLQAFNCANNTFIDGSLPSIRPLTLESLVINDNFIYGTVPSSYAGITELKIERNRLRGTLYVGDPFLCTVFDVSNPSNCFDCPYGSWSGSCTAEFCNGSTHLYPCTPYTLSPTTSPTTSPTSPTVSPTALPTSSPTRQPTTSPSMPSPSPTSSTTTSSSSFLSSSTTSSGGSIEEDNESSSGKGSQTLFIVVISLVAIFIIIICVILISIYMLKTKKKKNINRRSSSVAHSRNRSKRTSWRHSGGGYRSSYAPTITSLTSPYDKVVYDNLPGARSMSLVSQQSSNNQYEMMPTMDMDVAPLGYGLLPEGSKSNDSINI